MDIEKIKKRIAEAQEEGNIDEVNRLRRLLATLQPDDTSKGGNNNSADNNDGEQQSRGEDDDSEDQDNSEDSDNSDDQDNSDDSDNSDDQDNSDDSGEDRKKDDDDGRDKSEESKDGENQGNEGKKEGDGQSDSSQNSGESGESPSNSSKGSEGPQSQSSGTQSGGAQPQSGGTPSPSAGTPPAGGAPPPPAAASGATTGATTTGAATTGAATTGAATTGAATTGAATTAGTAAVAATPVGWVILGIIVLIIIIMLILGAISFFTTMPGLVKEKINEFLGGVWAKAKSIFQEEKAYVKDDEVVEIAQYLESMGYSIEGFGLGEVKERDTEGNIKTMKSKYISVYLGSDLNAYLIRGQNFSLGELFSSDFFGGPNAWGFGLIELDEGWSEWLNLIPGIGTAKVAIQGIDGGITINRETKSMVISKLNIGWIWNARYDKYSYSLEGWTGKYSKPLEFLLSLHLSTLAPDFAYEVATNKDFFDTSVVLGLYPIEATVSIVVKEMKNDEWTGKYIPVKGMDPDTLQKYGLTKEIEKAAADFGAVVKTDIPYIKRVEKHWYKNLDFSGCYKKETSNIDPLYYEYAGDNEKLSKTTGLYVKEKRNTDLVQISEPKEKNNSKHIKDLLSEKYIIYDGTVKTDEEKKEKYKRNIEFAESSANGGEVKSSDAILNGIAMLERVDGEDAQHILRYLKELLADYGVKLPNLGDRAWQQQFFNWVMPSHEPAMWPTVEEEPPLEYYTLIKKKTSDFPDGFNANSVKNIYAPAQGIITKIEKGVTDDETDDVYDSIEIEFREIDEELKGMVFTIYGISLSSGLQEGDKVQQDQQIGTTLDMDVRMKLKNKEMEYVRVAEFITPNKEKLPPGYKPLNY